MGIVVGELRGRGVPLRVADQGDIHESRQRAVGHRVPVVAAVGAGKYHLAAGDIPGARGLHRATGFRVDMRRPVHRDVGFGGDELAGLAVEDVEKAVLGRLHDDLAHLAIDCQVGEDHVLRRGVIPGIAGRGLVMPGVFARVRVDGQDRRQEQVVAAARTPDLAIPWRTVANADIQEIQIGIEGERVPGGAAAAHRPPLPGPGRRRHLHGIGFETVVRVAGHGVDAPDHVTGLGVVCGHVAADAILGAAVADDDLAVDDARRARDRVGRRALDRVDLPGLLAGIAVDGDQVAVECRDIDLVAPERDTAIGHVATGIGAPAARRLRVEGPEQLARRGIQRVDDAPRHGDVHDAVMHQRRRFHRAIRVDVEIPGETEIADIAVVDAGERTEALFVVASAGGQPVTGLGVRIDDAFAGYHARIASGRRESVGRLIIRATAGGEQERRQVDYSMHRIARVKR